MNQLVFMESKSFFFGSSVSFQVPKRQVMVHYILHYMAVLPPRLGT